MEIWGGRGRWRTTLSYAKIGMPEEAKVAMIDVGDGRVGCCKLPVV
ncbi:uncharacterized protein G2W53_035686 [Senna tora]|uniref:Uncharacterized protein n=1 Tax=Senna tora TaxID=362788 RepID=A0A834SR00_9FABA|nr:uncharacterized protein G2W53_035686 [Senna tora]